MLKLQKEISSILATAGFQLRKLLSNKPELLSKFQVDNNLPSNTLQLGASEQNKTLGILWFAASDTIGYFIKNISKDDQVTKRKILSVTSQIFDPLGLLGPVVVVTKLI